jgi:hypothetical protein
MGAVRAVSDVPNVHSLGIEKNAESLPRKTKVTGDWRVKGKAAQPDAGPDSAYEAQLRWAIEESKQQGRAPRGAQGPGAPRRGWHGTELRWLSTRRLRVHNETSCQCIAKSCVI